MCTATITVFMYHTYIIVPQIPNNNLFWKQESFSQILCKTPRKCGLIPLRVNDQHTRFSVNTFTGYFGSENSSQKLASNNNNRFWKATIINNAKLYENTDEPMRTYPWVTRYALRHLLHLLTYWAAHTERLHSGHQQIVTMIIIGRINSYMYSYTIG